MRRRALLLALVLEGCAHPRPSTEPLGGTESSFEEVPHRDRRAPGAEAPSLARDEADAETIEVASAPPPPASAPPPPPAAPATPPVSGVAFKYTPLKAGDTVRVSLELGANLSVDAPFGGGTNEVANLDATYKGRARVLRGTASSLEQIELQFSEGRVRAVLQGRTDEEAVSGEKYIVDFSGGAPSARNAKGQSPEPSLTASLVLALDPLVQLQRRLATPAAPIQPGWKHGVPLPHYATLVPPPPDVRVGPLELTFASVRGAAPNESASFDLTLPVTVGHDMGKVSVELRGSATLPPATMRPIDVSLSGPVSGAIPAGPMDVRLFGQMRYRARYEF